MEYFEKFINEVQTLEIKIREYYQREDGSIIREFTPKDNPNIDFRIVQCIDLSHYGDTDESNYEADLKELQQLALTDLLKHTQEIIKQQLKRLVQIENRFSRFWELYKDLHKDFREQKFETEQLIKKIESLFIVPKYKKGIISDGFIRHLNHAIYFKHGMLSGFADQVKKVLAIEQNDIPHQSLKAGSLKLPKDAKANELTLKDLFITYTDYPAIIKLLIDNTYISENNGVIAWEITERGRISYASGLLDQLCKMGYLKTGKLTASQKVSILKNTFNIDTKEKTMSKPLPFKYVKEFDCIKGRTKINKSL